jgi:hypothetical protein
MTTSTDYSGRTKDLFISQGVDPNAVGAKKIEYNFGAVSSYIAGIQKLIQRYIILLFNNNLKRELERVRYENPQEASHIFNFVNWKALQIIRTYQNEHPDTPEDEQLAGAELLSISGIEGTVTLNVRLVPVSGDATVFLLPINL